MVLENASRKKQNLLIDYIVSYQGKNDKPRRKVFKWKSLEVSAGDSVTLSKQHPMKQTTVRALYPGAHAIELQLNGVITDREEFQLSL